MASVGVLWAAVWAAAAQDAALQVRGLHVGAPSKKDIPAFVEFVRAISKDGVNTLIVEFGTRFDFRLRPEFANPGALDKDQVRRLAEACREAGLELIPQLNCLGHQSWDRNNGALLTKHPEFDETPGKFPDNKGIYCRSYCPLHPEVHNVVFDLIDELADACRAKSFHVGMDEVFILADPDCARCRGKSAAELFAGEVKTLHGHLKKINCRMWMWGDRFLDGKATGIGKWEASENGTAGAIDLVPKDIVVCDWHYDRAHRTPRVFADKGFAVVACPWKNPSVALEQLAMIREIKAAGVVQTTWCGAGAFIEAYNGKGSGNAAEAAACFRKLFENVRK